MFTKTIRTPHLARRLLIYRPWLIGCSPAFCNNVPLAHPHHTQLNFFCAFPCLGAPAYLLKRSCVHLFCQRSYLILTDSGGIREAAPNSRASWAGNPGTHLSRDCRRRSLGTWKTLFGFKVLFLGNIRFIMTKCTPSIVVNKSSHRMIRR